MGLAVQASKNPMSLIGLASKNPMSLIGGANKLLKRSKTARDVTGKLGVGGKLISNYYNDKESDKKSSQSTKSPEFTPLEKVALYHQEDAQQRRMFMISECAPGHSIDNYVAIITTAEESSLEKFLWVIRRTAMAFAQLHKRTERVL